MNKKILILYTSIGLGHKSIAENIGNVLTNGGAEVRLEDILVVQSGFLVRLSTKVHAFINLKLPFLWSFLYQSKLFIKLTLPYRTKIASRNCQNTKEIIREFNPDIIISTQTSASAIIAYLKETGFYEGLFGIAFSDFHLHEYWLYWQADFYLVNTEDQKREMLNLGISQEKIFVCGVTLLKGTTKSSEEIKVQMGILEEESVVLVGSGSLGTGISENLIFELSQIPKTRILVLCGKNEESWKKLSKKFKDTNVSIFSYYSHVDELYKITKVFITKPGGLSVSEALYYRIPILITHMLPGQEELNYNYLQSEGLVMPEPLNISEEVQEEIETGSFRKVLETNPLLLELFPSPEVLIRSILKVISSNQSRENS